MQGDSGHAQVDVLLRVYAQKQDKHHKKLIKTFEDNFYSESNKETEKTAGSDALLNLIKTDPDMRKKVLTMIFNEKS